MSSTLKTDKWVAGILIIVVIVACRQFFFNTVENYYALRYQVPVERVSIQKKPHDCEYESAPLGSKHCHYEAKVSTVPDNHGGVKFLFVNYERVED